jgi:hypothetical protein
VNGIPGRVEHLFGAIKNPTTGEPHANAEVARMSAGAIGLHPPCPNAKRTQTRISSAVVSTVKTVV